MVLPAQLITPKRQLNTVHTSSNQGPEQQRWYFPHHNPKSPFVHFTFITYVAVITPCDQSAHPGSASSFPTKGLPGPIIFISILFAQFFIFFPAYLPLRYPLK